MAHDEIIDSRTAAHDRRLDEIAQLLRNIHDEREALPWWRIFRRMQLDRRERLWVFAYQSEEFLYRRRGGD